MIEQLTTMLCETLQEPVELQYHHTGVFRFIPSGPSSGDYDQFWSERSNSGWFNTPVEAALNLAMSYGYYRPPSITDKQIEAAVINLITEKPLHYTARRLRSLANRQTGLIPCAPARCDEAVKRLIRQGRIVLVNPTKRSSGVLQLAQYANPKVNIQWINEPFEAICDGGS